MHGRFGHLRASAISPRLQLAALYAATSTLLPEPASLATGAETALQLLRQCWTSHSLAQEDLQQLRSVPRLGGHLAPGLHLLAHELELSAAQLDHSSRRRSKLGPDGATAYIHQAGALLPGGWGCSHRLLLTEEEELRVLGRASSRKAVAATPSWRRLGQYRDIECEVPGAWPVEQGLVERLEQSLLQLVVPPSTAAPAGQPYLLQGPSASAGDGQEGTWLERWMHEQLEESWVAHHSTPAPAEVVPGAAETITSMQVGLLRCYTAAPLRSRAAELPSCRAAELPSCRAAELLSFRAAELLSCIVQCANAMARLPQPDTPACRLQGLVSFKRRQAEAYLLLHVGCVPTTTGHAGTAFRLLRSAAALPGPAPLDLLAAAFQPQLLRDFNPFLSHAKRQRLQPQLLEWLKLCVLEDRLGRLLALARAAEAAGRDNWAHTAALIQAGR